MSRKIVAVPMTPNFIKYNGFMWPISDFDDKELCKIGKAWTENLIKKARKIPGNSKRIDL